MRADELKKRTTNVYFAKRFSELIKEWKKRTGKTQRQFAKDCFSNPNSITNYKNGTDFPSPAMINEILRVFNDADMDVTIEDFLPYNKDEDFLYDPDILKIMQKLNREFANEIGLSEDFLNFLFKCTGFSDPDEGYPVWSGMDDRLVHSFKTQEKELKYLEGFDIVEFYHYPMLQTRAVTDKTNEFTARGKDGASTIIQTVDLHILKDLQDNIVDIIKYFYFKRRKELKAQEIEMIKLANPIIKCDGQPPFVGTHKFTKDELIEIDPYKKYLDWKDWKDEEV